MSQTLYVLDINMYQIGTNITAFSSSNSYLRGSIIVVEFGNGGVTSLSSVIIYKVIPVKYSAKGFPSNLLAKKDISFKK